MDSDTPEYPKTEFAERFGLPGNKRLAKVLNSKFAAWLDELNLPETLISDLEFIYLPVCNYILNSDAYCPEKTTIIGINGSQGSGKTTFSYLLAKVLSEAYPLKVVSCSIDDFYLTLEERESLSREVHPLLLTRGVPGTHDVEFAIEIFNSLCNATEQTVTKIPVFDKAIDDRKTKEEWVYFQGRPDLILFEGWCVGSAAVRDSELDFPINELESTKDQEGVFRRFSNDKLRNEYANWFGMTNLLFMLQVPGFDQVMEWRWIQEKKLAEKHSGEISNKRIMTEAETRFFISHFERITRQMLRDMPQIANVVFRINESHAIDRIKINRK